MNRMDLAPPPPRDRAQEDFMPAREITDADLRPLRDDFEWRPTIILKRFGSAESDAEYLPKLIVACAVLHGVHRVQDLTERLIALNNINQPRINQMAGEETLGSRKGPVKDIRRRLNTARVELAATRARCNNDVDTEPLQPDGLRLLDLTILTYQTETTILAHEVARRRNVAGVDFALSVVSRRPSMEFAEEWCDRVFGAEELGGLLLFLPRAYGRVVVVFDDGRLAYDPGAPTEEEGGIQV
ncbi:MAG: hypothetical protein AAFN74_07660 [Myxococcota bacterium]